MSVVKQSLADHPEFQGWLKANHEFLAWQVDEEEPTEDSHRYHPLESATQVALEVGVTLKTLAELMSSLVGEMKDFAFYVDYGPHSGPIIQAQPRC